MPNVITRISNPVEFHEADPEIETHHDALYLPIAGPEPWETNHGWGLFDHDGRLIEAAAYHRGPGKTLLGQCERIDPSAYDISDSDETVIYVGTYIDHFGHFLLTTVARLWADETFGFRDARLLGHGAGVPPGWLSHPYARQLLAAIDVDATHFVPPSGPIRFKTVIVPRPSLEEHNFVHSAYKRICGTIGDRLLLSAKKEEHGPTYLSKSKLYQSVQRPSNEGEIEDILAGHGVRIIYPEHLTLSEQVAVFRDSECVMGFTGSAFHTSVLGPRSARLIVGCPDPWINSNMHLVDLANQNRATHIQVEAVTEPAERTLRAFRLLNPVQAAQAMLDAASNGS